MPRVVENEERGKTKIRSKIIRIRKIFVFACHTPGMKYPGYG